MHTNETQYYGLPQYVGSDIINPLVDTNTAYQKIDTALHNIAEEAGQGTSDIANLQTKVGSASLDTTAQDLSGAVNELNGELDDASTGVKARLDAIESDVDTLQGQMVTAQGNITDLQYNKANQSEVDTALALKANQNEVDAINTKIGTGEPTTTDKTLIGSVNEINAHLNNGKFRVDETVEMGKVTADGVKTFSELIADLRTAVLATLTASYNANARFGNVTVFSPVLNFIRDENAPALYRATSQFIDTFADVNLTNGDIVITQLNFGTSALVHNVAGVYTDISSDVPASGTEITVYGIRYVAD